MAEYVVEYKDEGMYATCAKERVVRCRDCKHAITSYRDGLPRCAGPLVMIPNLALMKASAYHKVMTVHKGEQQ